MRETLLSIIKNENGILPHELAGELIEFIPKLEDGFVRSVENSKYVKVYPEYPGFRVEFYRDESCEKLLSEHSVSIHSLVFKRMYLIEDSEQYIYEELL